MHFYVYYSYEEWGRGYIGCRQCSCPPEEDTKYFGSYFDSTFSPTHKIILQVCSSRQEAIECEVALHDFFEVGDNPHFANQSKQRKNGFFYNKRGEEHHGFGKLCPEHSDRMSGEGNPMYGKRGEESPHYGKKRPDHSQKISGENHYTYGKSKEEHPLYGRKNPDHSERLKGRKWWANAEGVIKYQHDCPGEGWTEGDARKLKGRKWWTNAEGDVKFQHDRPGEGWVESDSRRKVKGQDHPMFGKKNPIHSEKMTGNKHWVNEKGEKRFQRESPGEGWRNGLKWKPLP